jgi:hypothetical protein
MVYSNFIGDSEGFMRIIGASMYLEGILNAFAKV